VLALNEDRTSERFSCVYNPHSLQTRYLGIVSRPTSCSKARYNLYLQTVSRNWLRGTNYRPFFKESRESKLRPSVACCLRDVLQWLAILFHIPQSLSPDILFRVYSAASGTPLAKRNAVLQRICLADRLATHLTHGMPSLTHRTSRVSYLAAFDVLTTTVLDSQVVWDVTLYSLSYRSFGGTAFFLNVAET
jgi:hypothetical protein